ncbi:hypothetical protein CQ006_25690 [Pseudomonas cedrina]|uniref:Uncharacterized protein n=1 Tax=Pseudomonas cedrina TaxID=651740 RepID=A0A2S9D5X3_PSECE|nr:hypothetical protein CQ006_25690 [Pseudomonas cedrina]
MDAVTHCGEGACSRSPAQRVLAFLGGASHPSGSKLPRHKSQLPHWVLCLSSQAQQLPAANSLRIGQSGR